MSETAYDCTAAVAARPAQTSCSSEILEILKGIGESLSKIAENTTPEPKLNGDVVAAKKLIAYASIAKLGGNVSRIAEEAGLGRATLNRDLQFMSLVNAFRDGGRIGRIRKGGYDAQTGNVEAWEE